MEAIGNSGACVVNIVAMVSAPVRAAHGADFATTTVSNCGPTLRDAFTAPSAVRWCNSVASLAVPSGDVTHQTSDSNA